LVFLGKEFRDLGIGGFLVDDLKSGQL